ncbi:hypothetical protein Pmani_033760 [Petrolisthes manimaculis]|uniref:carnosine N-methyltransferase n=1 Tax=Petrolisthes manimaculis TaxID=1843537 RepID=A0AAE1NP34_9EUCA|nr:hypothetical protein Pmani_033760 [Petrolisthes manimaculis]KAK4293549.1 hypothetical protein Pmani_033760 [Petrolisthes manimaculis]
MFPLDKGARGDIKVLVPGAGLGRLAYDLAKRGFTCQGNEFSLFMLFASNFVLNKCRGINSLRVYPWVHTGSVVVLDSLRVYPWVHTGSNTLSTEDQLTDRLPSLMWTLLTCQHTLSFTMAAGDFLEIYTSADAFDCVATCFFIDCANNIVAFLQTIYNIIKPGGYWVNLGPLLYHFADQPGEPSIEPTYQHIKSIAIGIGFTILEEETGVNTSYTQNPNSMLQYEYKSVLFVAQKKTNRKTEQQTEETEDTEEGGGSR